MIKRTWLVNVILLLFIALTACTSAPKDFCENAVKELTAKEYQGRLVGSEGNEKAAAYIVDAYGEIGLIPWSGESYDQEYAQRTVDPDEQQPSIIVHYKNGEEETLVNGRDYLVTEVAKDFSAFLPFAIDENPEGIYITDDVVDAVQSGQDVCLVSCDSFRAVARLPEEDDSLMIYVTPEVYSRINVRGENADIEVHATVKESTVANVAGIIKGKDRSKAVVISAHFDHMGWQGDMVFLGALDNASGVAVLLSTAGQVKALLGEKEPAVDLIFVACNSEELRDRGEGEGCMGSTAFVKAVKPMYSSLFNINIDCVGGKASGPLAMGTADEMSEPLAEELKQWMNGAGIPVSDACYDVGDHTSFRHAGIPAMVLGQELGSITPYIHVPTDTADKLDYEQIGQISTALAEFLTQKEQSVFSSFAEENMIDAYMDETAWQENAQKELKELLGDKELAYNERYCFEMDGYIVRATGYRPFSGLIDLQAFFPEAIVPEVLMGYELQSIDVWQYGIYPALDRSKHAYDMYTLHQKEQIGVDINNSYRSAVIYKSDSDFLELRISGPYDDPSIEEIIPLEGLYAGYSLHQMVWDEAGVYESIVYPIGDWEVGLYPYQIEDGEREYIIDYATKDDMLVLLDSFMAETSPEEILEGLGIE